MGETEDKAKPGAAVVYRPPEAGIRCVRCGGRATVRRTIRSDSWTIRYLYCRCGWSAKTVEGHG